MNFYTSIVSQKEKVDVDIRLN